MPWRAEAARHLTAAVLVLVVSAMQGWMALVVVTAFPLLSGLCLLLS